MQAGSAFTQQTPTVMHSGNMAACNANGHEDTAGNVLLALILMQCKIGEFLEQLTRATASSRLPAIEWPWYLPRYNHDITYYICMSAYHSRLHTTDVAMACDMHQKCICTVRRCKPHLPMWVRLVKHVGLSVKVTTGWPQVWHLEGGIQGGRQQEVS